eukprot:26974-Pleurochrysis_carterae.AAC.1
MWPARPSTGGRDDGAEPPSPRLAVEAPHTPALQACSPASAQPASATATDPARAPGTERVLGCAEDECQSIAQAHPDAFDCRERAQPS